MTELDTGHNDHIDAAQPVEISEKDRILSELRTALHAGVVSDADVRSILPVHGTLPHESTPALVSGVVSPAAGPVELQSTAMLIPGRAAEAHPEKLSAVEVMFYISGIILFGSIISMIMMSWEDGSPFMHIAMSAGVGFSLWLVAKILDRQPNPSDIIKGLENAVILTGSLCVIAGGFIITSELTKGSENINYIAAAFTFAVLGALHVAYDRIVRKDLTLLLGLFLSIASFPTLVFGILADSELPPDVWSLIFIASLVLLVLGARVLGRMHPDRPVLMHAYDTFAVFMTLLTMFVSTFSDYGLIWVMILIGSVFGLFYVSIVTQNKQFLGNASFFLVVSVLTITFKYFSGAGVTVSLMIAAISLLASAAIASSINKKYFKESPQ